MDIRPILSTLRRHKTAAALIVLEVALTCAIVCNALFLVSQRVEKISMPSGIAENELVMLRVSGIGKQTDAMARTREDLASLRALPGVSNVTIINQVPFRNGSSSSSISREIDQERPTTNASMYTLSENGLATMGINLIAGRDFLPGEYQNFEDASKGGRQGKRHPGHPHPGHRRQDGTQRQRAGQDLLHGQAAAARGRHRRHAQHAQRLE